MWHTRAVKRRPAEPTTTYRVDGAQPICFVPAARAGTASQHAVTLRRCVAAATDTRSNPSTATRGALRVLRSGTCGQRPRR
jgi:hypothetical protein